MNIRREVWRLYRGRESSSDKCHMIIEDQEIIVQKLKNGDMNNDDLVKVKLC